MKTISTMILMTLIGLSLPAAAQLTLELDADEYTVGDMIQITITNTGSQDIEFWSAPPWCVYNIDDGCMFSAVPSSSTFGAGETLIEYFDTSSPVLTPGECAVFIDWHLGGEDFLTTVYFYLEDSVDNESMDWSTLKAEYH